MSTRNNEVRLTIEKLRNEGMTFQEISLYLKDNMDVTMTRQAVHSMWNRMNNKNIGIPSDSIITIVALDYFGRSNSKICEIMKVGSDKCKLVDIALKNNKDMYKEVDELVKFMVQQFNDNLVDMKGVVDGIYKSFGVKVQPSELCTIIYDEICKDLKVKLKQEFGQQYLKIGNAPSAEKAFKKMCSDINELGRVTKFK